jgi:hypothetical protein
MMTKKLLLTLLIIMIYSVSYAQPVAPTNLTASIEKWFGLKYVLLKWDMGTANTHHSNGFNIYRKEGSIKDTNAFVKLSGLVHNNFFQDKLILEGKTYSYYVTATNMKQESQPSDTVEVIISDTTTPVLISGTLTDEVTGSALKGGKVELVPYLGWNLKSIKVDTNGNYSASVNPGKYFIYFQSPGYIPEFYDNAKSIFTAKQVDLTENSSTVINAVLRQLFNHPQYVLSGTVTDTSGQPVKAKISVFILNRYWFNRSMFKGMTDSAGNYSIHVRGGDSVVVFAESKNRNFISEFYNNKNTFAEADRIYINGDITGINFVLESKPVFNNSISGKITDTSNNAVMASVTLFSLWDNKHPRYKRTVLTDSLGNYSFINIQPGSYILFTHPEYGFLPTFFRNDGQQTVKWKEADSIIVTETSVIDNLNVQVLPVPDSGYCLVRGIITDEQGAGINGAIVFALDENNNTAAFASTDENGKYEINYLVPGNYTVLSDKVDFENAEQSNVSIGYSGSLEQTVSLAMKASSVTSVETGSTRISDFKLSQNYPNPFNPVTSINYQIPVTGFVSLKVYNVIGQEVATLVNEVKNAGNYRINFDASKYNSGIYFYTLKSGNVTISHKMALIK